MMCSPDQLMAVAIRLLERRGVPAEAARIQADLLIEAELRGLPSHGIQRLPRLLARIDRRLADPAARAMMTWTRPAFLSVDSRRGLGPVVMLAAIAEMRASVAAHGMATAAIRNANHIGMLAYYVDAVARSGLIAIVASTSEALVHPFGGTEPMLGTNPVAIGIPTADEPFVLDIATSLVPMGKIHHHALRGEPIPLGWAVDGDGRPTTSAQAAKSGAIAPFGDAKGYGLGLAIELIVAALCGSEMAPAVRGTLDEEHPANKGDLIILIDPAAGGDRAAALSAYLQKLRASRPLDPDRPVSVPGDGARRRKARIGIEGIEVPDALWNDLLALEAA
jgi:LDH2 family malate/lactate/ureidoglycolate dehydrogenase